MALLVHINGAPGVGKLTVARLVAPRLRARLLDNHAIYNIAFALADFRSPAFYDLARRSRHTAYDHLARASDAAPVLLTDAWFAGSPWAQECASALSTVREQLGGRLLSIRLRCRRDEHERRISHVERLLRGKISDTSILESLTGRRLLEFEADADMELDVTGLGPEEASSILFDWIMANGGSDALGA